MSLRIHSFLGTHLDPVLGRTQSKPLSSSIDSSNADIAKRPRGVSSSVEDLSMLTGLDPSKQELNNIASKRFLFPNDHHLHITDNIEGYIHAQSMDGKKERLFGLKSLDLAVKGSSSDASRETSKIKKMADEGKTSSAGIVSFVGLAQVSRTSGKTDMGSTPQYSKLIVSPRKGSVVDEEQSHARKTLAKEYQKFIKGMKSKGLSDREIEKHVEEHPGVFHISENVRHIDSFQDELFSEKNKEYMRSDFREDNEEMVKSMRLNGSSEEEIQSQLMSPERYQASVIIDRVGTFKNASKLSDNLRAIRGGCPEGHPVTYWQDAGDHLELGKENDAFHPEMPDPRLSPHGTLLNARPEGSLNNINFIGIASGSKHASFVLKESAKSWSIKNDFERRAKDPNIATLPWDTSGAPRETKQAYDYLDAERTRYVSTFKVEEQEKARKTFDSLIFFPHSGRMLIARAPKSYYKNQVDILHVEARKEEYVANAVDKKGVSREEAEHMFNVEFMSGHIDVISFVKDKRPSSQDSLKKLLPEPSGQSLPFVGPNFSYGAMDISGPPGYDRADYAIRIDSSSRCPDVVDVSIEDGQRFVHGPAVQRNILSPAERIDPNLVRIQDSPGLPDIEGKDFSDVKYMPRDPSDRSKVVYKRYEVV